jgi:hypothetical protein
LICYFQGFIIFWHRPIMVHNATKSLPCVIVP